MSARMGRDAYLTKNAGDFPSEIVIGGRKYAKVEDLRYGTNPHQPAVLYRPVDGSGAIMDMKTLKSGKSGLSQTNLEDISGAINIIKYFGNTPACAVMKHVNPSGAAVLRAGETLKDVYIKARDCDARAAFGSAIAFNVKVDAVTAEEIMSSFVECVVAPAYDKEALAIFNDSVRFKVNGQIRILQCGDISKLPKYVGDDASGDCNTMKVLCDGSLVVAAPLLTKVRTAKDIPAATGESKKIGVQKSEIEPSKEQLDDLLAAWYINISVRSNGVVIVRNGQTLSVGTGEQDRVGAVEQAIEKYRQKYSGPNSIEGAVMSSDGFFPFPDAVEVAAAAGIKAIVAPSGSLKDAEVIQRANELGIALRHAPERIFSHH
jgi:phosphoribosylaminoimidazolecarboxamide formyltransferase / IMP cyclohydrolase